MPETQPEERQPREPKARGRFQFGLGAMLLAAVPVSLLAAAWAGMMGLGAENSAFPQGVYVVGIAAVPMAVMVLVSVGRAVIDRRSRGGRGREDD